MCIFSRFQSMCIYNYILIGLTLDKKSFTYLLMNFAILDSILSGFFSPFLIPTTFFSLLNSKTVSLSLFFLSFLVKPDLLFYSLLIQYILDIIFIVTL